MISGLARIDDQIRVDVICNELARVFEIDPEGLRMRHSRRSGTAAAAAGRGAVARKVTGRRVSLERLALRLITEGTPSALDAIDTLDTDDFCDADLRKFYKSLDLARECSY